MLEIKLLRKEEDFTQITRPKFIDFLFEHLGEFGDPKKDIERCLNYAFSDSELAGLKEAAEAVREKQADVKDL